MAGKVTVGLASHWPCVTDSVVYPPTDSVACEMEMSTLHAPLEYYSIFTFYTYENVWHESYVSCCTNEVIVAISFSWH